MKQQSTIKLKIDFIKAKLNSYSNIVNASISESLFDEAVLFEEFAKKICSFYFDQCFINLNSINPNWKCVDLMSDDKIKFVQVSATKNTKTKINETIKNIRLLRNKNDPSVKDIKELYFFFLNSVKVDNIKKHTIDGIVFDPQINIITLNDVIKKVRHNDTFRNNVFDYLHEEDESLKCIETRLYDAIQNSKNSFLTDISTNIGDEDCHIDRSALINSLKQIDSKIVVITGESGVGKSALCKEIVKDTKIVLFARADELIGSQTTDDLWNLNLRKAITYLKNKSITICIDSLEFVSDCLGKDKILDKVFVLAKEYNNLKIFVTCRTRDALSFEQVFSKYTDIIHQETIGGLNADEKDFIWKKYPILNKLPNKYKELITTPLYADIIVKNLINAKISKETELKKEIYKNCICLSNKYPKDKNNIIKTIKTIVIQRSKERKLGVDRDSLNDRIVNILINNNVVVENRHAIRLKFDLFEDICFGEIFDELFADKDSIDSFLKNVSILGDSAFRRYQLWVGDLIKEGRNAEISEILAWGTDKRLIRDTLIGILSSKESETFLQYYLSNCRANYQEMIDICNEYSFELVKNKEEYLFKPIGVGRKVIVNSIPLSEIKNKGIDINSVLLLLNGLLQQPEFLETSSKSASDIANQIFTDELKEEYIDFDLLDKVMDVVFYTQVFSSKWFIPLMNDILNKYLNKYFRDGKHILELLFRFRIEQSCKKLVTYSPEFVSFMIDLSYKYFTIKPKEKISRTIPFYYSEHDLFDERNGFSEAANELSNGRYYFQSPFVTSFFVTLVDSDLKSALLYLFKLSDFYGNYLFKKGTAKKIEINLNDNKKEYIYHQNLMFLGESENSEPRFLADMFFVIKTRIELLLSLEKTNTKRMVDQLVKLCFNDSNTVASLSILTYLNHYLFSYSVPSVFSLAESYEIVIDDLILFQQENYPDINVEILKREIYQQMGIPYQTRYQIKRKIDLASCLYNLFHVIPDKNIYIETMNDIYKKYEKESNAIKFYEAHDGSKITYEQAIKNQQKQIEEKSNYIDRNNYIQSQIKSIINEKDENRAKELIKYILSLPKNEMIVFSRWLVYAISIVIMNKNLSSKERNYYCGIWINIIKDKKPFDEPLVVALVGQLNFNISSSNRRWVKRYTFDVLTLQNETTKEQLINPILGFLSVNEKLRNEFINALIGCAGIHYAVFGGDKNKTFNNKEYENLLKKENELKEEVINSCLFDNKKYDFSNVDFNKCDIQCLERISALILASQSADIRTALSIFDFILSEMIKDKNGRTSNYISNRLASNLNLALISDISNGPAIIDYLFEFIKTHQYNGSVFEVVADFLNKIEKRLLGSEEEKMHYFQIAEHLINKYKEIESFDIKGEIILGIIGVNKYGSFASKKLDISLNQFQKKTMISLLSMVNPLCLESLIKKINTFSPDLLCPEIIPLIADDIDALIKNGNRSLINKFREPLETFICNAFYHHSDTIKGNQLYSKTFNYLLEQLAFLKSVRINVIEMRYKLL